MPGREEIKQEVIEALKDHTGKSNITEEHHLTFDLDMSTNSKKSMALEYSNISIRYGGSSISSNKAAELETVKEAVDLVYSKTNPEEGDEDEA
tara:strand:+ start:159 stop:437 length:279 start_codon:yes stop_codon:yes gene_type:complete